MINQQLFMIVRVVEWGQFIFDGRAGSITNYIHVDDVVSALAILAQNPSAKGEIFILSSDCTWEDLIKKTALLLNVPQQRIKIPAILARTPMVLISGLVKRWIHVSTFDTLVNKTSYAAQKFDPKLNYKFLKPLPNSIKELTDHVNSRAQRLVWKYQFCL
jgi:nucleoside-diphosphate-sugar epimerase